MGLFKSKQEKVLDYIYAHYMNGMTMTWEQLPGNREKHGFAPWPGGPTTPEGRRLEMSRTHSAVLNSACRRAMMDKRMTVEPDVLSREYWRISCLHFALGDPEATPNPFA
jgi:hypothetical protein